MYGKNNLKVFFKPVNCKAQDDYNTCIWWEMWRNYQNVWKVKSSYVTVFMDGKLIRSPRRCLIAVPGEALENKALRLQGICRIQELKIEQKSVNGRDGWVYGGPPTEFQKELEKSDGRRPTGAPWASFLGGQGNCRAKVLESICRRKCRHDLGASRLAHYF